jgi:di/tricarboxylate transporter
MSVEIASILVLAGMFLFATLTPVNMGLLGFVAAYVVGVFMGGMSPKDIAKSLPADLFITLLGVTFLFAVVQGNGAIGRMIAGASALVGPRKHLLPWVMFVIAAVLTGIGALSPAAVAILAPLAMTFARANGLNPMLSGLLVVHGAQAGGFSPLSVYGGITRDAVEKGGLLFDPFAPFLASLAMNSIAALALYLVLGRIAAAREQVAGVEASPPAVMPTGGTWTAAVTFGGLFALAVLTLVFKLEIGFVAIAIGLGLSLMSLKTHRQMLQRLPWSEIVLIAGVATYVGVLQTMGVVTWAADQVSAMSSPAIAALFVLYIAAVVSAFASSTAVLGSLIPLAVPLLTGQPPIAVAAFIGAIAVATTIVDVSPFSTNGALVLASAEEHERQRLYRRLILYGTMLTVFAPPILWAIYLAVKG